MKREEVERSFGPLIGRTVVDHLIDHLNTKATIDGKYEYYTKPCSLDRYWKAEIFDEEIYLTTPAKLPRRTSYSSVNTNPSILVAIIQVELVFETLAIKKFVASIDIPGKFYKTRRVIADHVIKASKLLKFKNIGYHNLRADVKDLIPIVPSSEIVKSPEAIVGLI
jgi:hypothetical protein